MVYSPFGARAASNTHGFITLRQDQCQDFVDTDCAVMPPMSTINRWPERDVHVVSYALALDAHEHRTNEAENDEPRATQLKDCADGCTQCIDHSLRALRAQSLTTQVRSICFFATMAAIPPPPTMRVQEVFP
ncbi:hypothetical protein BDQ17DRAFT_1441174 [Cyathus striatus]|nr:hypothetical protein BDQ17DRAFT_1441174 [Cyathus striatus]